MNKIKRIEIIGRRWFQTTYGNTYHSVEIMVNDKPVDGVDFAYGYGDHYIQTATEQLTKLGILPDISRTPFWRYCEEHGIKTRIICIDVNRKKDL